MRVKSVLLMQMEIWHWLMEKVYLLVFVGKD
jgi:hypothetical protein